MSMLMIVREAEETFSGISGSISLQRQQQHEKKENNVIRMWALG